MVGDATRRIVLAAAIGVATGCAPHRGPEVAASPSPAERTAASAGAAVAVAPAAGGAQPAARVSCAGCATLPVWADLAAAIEQRVAELKARGGECAEYGAVLDGALAGGHITVRPYMWRVEGNLASAQGESSGEMTIARDIDSLNVGVRRLDEVLRSAEHEAAHIALHIPSGDPVREARIEDRIDSCRSMQRRY